MTITAKGIFLVPIPRVNGLATKAPVAAGWNKPRAQNNRNGYSDDPIIMQGREDWNFGIYHGASNTLAFDIDDMAKTLDIFDDIGCDIRPWLNDLARLEIKSPSSNRGKLLFKMPSGAYKLHQLNGVFELRCGNCQDVIYGEHPNGGFYSVIGDIKNIPDVPEILLNMVTNWLDWKKIFTPEKTVPKPSKKSVVSGQDVALFNARYSVSEILLRNGYKQTGKRFIRPNSATGVPAVILYEDGFIYSHGSDALNNGHTHDAFNCYKILECDDDFAKAIKWNRSQKVVAHEAVPIREGVAAEIHADYLTHDKPALSWDYPHQSDRGDALATTENLVWLFAQYGIECYYDEILKKIFIVTQNDTSNDISDNGKLEIIKSIISLNNFPDKIKDRIAVILMQNCVNPVLQYLESGVWDGVSRIDALCESIKVKEFDREYRNALIKMWLVQCVAAADCGEKSPIIGALSKFESVLVFQGEQGGKKTSWLGSIVPKSYRCYVKDGVILDIADKDSRKQALSGWIVELGELDGTFRRSDIAKLKAFLSNDVDEIRMPYAAMSSQFRRRTSFFASVNEDKFLNDATGNRRFLPLQVLSTNPAHGVDLGQLWAEVYQLYINGAEWWPDELLLAMLVDRHEEHTAINNIEDAVSVVFDLSEKPSWGNVLTCTEILTSAGRSQPTKSDVNQLAVFLRKNGFAYKKQTGKRGFIINKILN